MTRAGTRWPRAAILVAIGATLAGVAALVGLTPGARAVATPADEIARPRRLIIAADGLSAEAFAEARRRGLFARFTYSATHVAPYPSMSGPSWASLLGTARMFGARGVTPSVEARWFDLETNRIVDDPREIIARHASPYSHYRAFDSYFDPITEPLIFLPGRTMADRELAETERAILDRFTGREFVAYVGGSDATSHTHLDALGDYLTRLDAMIARVADSLAARGTPAELWLMSDHGNVGAFREGEREAYLRTVSLDGAVKRAGLARVDTGTLSRENDVAVVDLALGTMSAIYFADLARRRAFAASALREPGVELVTWLEVTPSARFVVALGADGAEAHVRWRTGANGVEYVYERVHGNPLDVPDSLGSTRATTRWITDATARSATRTSHFPDALHRLVRAAEHEVENEPDLIVNLRDGYCMRGALDRAVRMVRSHGALSARSSAGILATTEHALPASVRSDEVLSLIGLEPTTLFAHAAPSDDASTKIATAIDDHSPDAEFLRRARPIALSIGYFRMGAVRALLGAARGASDDDGVSSRFTRTRRLLSGVDPVGAASGHLDALLPIADSIAAPPLGDRLRAAERTFAGITELAPLAHVRGVWTGASHAGGGANARRLAMAAWTLPYFLDAALLAPEDDSIADTRDAAFARRWFGARDGGLFGGNGVRDEVRTDPSMLLTDTTLAPRVFTEAFAERRLARAIEPALLARRYDPDVSQTTLVYVPGIYDELFDGEIWSRGLRAARERLAMRTLTVPVDGRCASSINARRIVDALRADTRRRLERGYAQPRYLLLGYSKGGVDATEALLLAPDLARAQVAALVTIATPHMGSPVAEREPMPDAALAWGVSTPRPVACDTAGSAASLAPAVRAAFWSAHGDSLAALTRFFSVSFATSAEHAHPWMKITKRVAAFRGPNDGVVALSASRFPRGVAAVDLGVVDADHIAGRLASAFPQEAFVEALVSSVAELGGLEPDRADRWRRVAIRYARDMRRDDGRVPAFASDVRATGGTRAPRASTWTAGRTIRASDASSVAADAITIATARTRPDGVVFRCDQRDMTAFRREYEFSYDASSGGREHDANDGFALVADPDAANGRACHLASRGSAVKMTTIAHRFAPTDFSRFGARVRVVRDVAGVDASTASDGKNDAALKIWLVLRDTRATDDRVMMLGYLWASPSARGIAPAAGTLQEAASSKRNLLVTTLPEAWLVAVGGPSQRDQWVTIDRDFAADVHRAYPSVPLSALQVVAITVQTDSDETRGSTAVLVESFGFTAGVSRVAGR